MPRHRRSRGTNWLGPILVALIVAAVAWTVSDRLPATSNPASGTVATSTTLSSTSTPDVLVELGIPMPRVDRDIRLRVDLSSGSSTKVAVPAGWRTESLTTDPDLTLTPFGDGFRLTGTDNWDIVLRRENGELYGDPQILGRFDQTHVAILAKSNTRQILLVTRAGAITVLADVPDNANVLGYAGGYVWFSTFIPGEGIESAPQGPSKLTRVSMDAKQEVEATSDSVINTVVADATHVAYGTEGGTFSVVNAIAWTDQGLPLLWLPDGRLLVADGTSLLVTDGTHQVRVDGTVQGEPDSAVVVE